MTILSLDTTSNFGSVAIRSHGRIVSEVTLDSTSGFAHLIFDVIERCKNEAKLDLDQVDCFAAASGPGSFTGLRVGLSAIKGLAESTGKRALGVSKLRVLSSFGKSSIGKKAVVLDARRGEVYAAVYDRQFRLVSAETVLPFTDWLAQLDSAEEYEFISPAPLPVASTPFARMPFTEAPSYLAAAVALCAEQDGREGKWLDPAAVDANYVRRSDAELFWRDA